MPKEKNEMKVNSKAIYKILAENKELLKQQYVKPPSSEEIAPMDQTKRIGQGSLSAFHRPIPLYPIAPYPSQVGYNNPSMRVALDQYSLNAFHCPIPLYPIAPYPSQVGYNNSRTIVAAIPIAPEPTLEEQRAASAKYHRLRRKKRKGKLITKEDELTDQEKIAKKAYRRNQRKGNFVIPISIAPEPTLEEQKAAKSKESSLYRKKRKGEIITKEDELTDQEKISLKAYKRNQRKGNFVKPVSIVPDPTLPTRNMFLSYEEGRISEGSSKRRKIVAKV